MSFDYDYHVIVKTEDQESIVYNYLEKIGFINTGNGKSIKSGHEVIRVYVQDKKFQSLRRTFDGSIFDFDQFMEKYAMTNLKSKIEEAKNKTHMSLHQMSKAIGFNEHYLSAVVKRNRSIETQDKVIMMLDDLIQKSQQELTHDFEGKALNAQVEDAMMISKSEYESMKKELDHKNQVLDKRNDLYANLELQLKDKDDEIKKIERNYDVLLDSNKNLNKKMLLAEQDSEKWQCDYWTVSRENVELINSKRAISICLAVSILIIVLMVVYAVLHFNGVV